MRRPRKGSAARARPRRRRRPPAAEERPGSRVEVHGIESLRQEIDRLASRAAPPRWNANPDDVKRSVVKLVLTLVEFIRQILERQAIRRLDAGTLTEEETEAIGMALMRLEETLRELGALFDLTPEDLNLDLGPIGKLM